jgi:hypothetical protein
MHCFSCALIHLLSTRIDSLLFMRVEFGDGCTCHVEFPTSSSGRARSLNAISSRWPVTIIW